MGNMEEMIKAKASELGYESCGIIEGSIFEEFLAQLNRRSALFPHSGSFYDRIRKLAAPKESLEWAKSIVVCLRRYDKYKIPKGLERFIGKLYLLDFDLSYSKEYLANVSFERFLQDLGFRTAQNAVPARWSAVKAGLGKFRKNNFLYTEQGSWNLIDTWVVDKKLEYEKPIESNLFPCPKGCDKCIGSCPTRALSAPLTMDATRCIAYLSYTPGLLPAENLRDKMGTWLYGCDICQNVCPANAETWQGDDSYFPEPWPLQDLITLPNLATMDEETFKKKIQPRFPYLGKDDIWQWKCNAIRAMANEYLQEYENYFMMALADSNENVRKMGVWALEKVRH